MLERLKAETSGQGFKVATKVGVGATIGKGLHPEMTKLGFDAPASWAAETGAAPAVPSAPQQPRGTASWWHDWRDETSQADDAGPEQTAALTGVASAEEAAKRAWLARQNVPSWGPQARATAAPAERAEARAAVARAAAEVTVAAERAAGKAVAQQAAAEWSRAAEVTVAAERAAEDEALARAAAWRTLIDEKEAEWAAARAGEERAAAAHEVARLTARVQRLEAAMEKLLVFFASYLPAE